MKKATTLRLSALLLAGATSFCFVGCNSTKTEDTPNTDVETISSPADADPTISDRVIIHSRDSAQNSETQPANNP